MKKRILTFIIACCMLFALVGLTACNSNEFPSPVENFTIDDFNDEFFENYSMIIVPYVYPISIPQEIIIVYTTFVENGELVFLLEKRMSPYRVGNMIPTDFRFILILPHNTFESYSNFRIESFYAYRFENDREIRNNRRWLRDVRQNSITTTVANVVRCNYRAINAPNMTPITSVAGLMLRTL